jgi:hypothetical protein
MNPKTAKGKSDRNCTDRAQTPSLDLGADTENLKQNLIPDRNTTQGTELSQANPDDYGSEQQKYLRTWKLESRQKQPRRTE